MDNPGTISTNVLWAITLRTLRNTDGKVGATQLQLHTTQFRRRAVQKERAVHM